MVAISLLPTPLEAGCSSETPLRIDGYLEFTLETTTSSPDMQYLGLNLMVFLSGENPVTFYAFFVIIAEIYLEFLVLDSRFLSTLCSVHDFSSFNYRIDQINAKVVGNVCMVRNIHDY